MGQTEERAIHPFFRKDLGVPTSPPAVDNDLFPTRLQECNGSPVSQTPSVAAALDHDPNAERRKRRRTDTNSADTFAGDIITTPDNLNDSTENEIAAPPVQTQGNCISIQVLAPSEQGQHQQPLTNDANPTPCEFDQKKQKVIKLNANGKLLSSPVADRFTDKSKMKGNKRGKAGPKPTENPKSKLVIIKYIKKEGVSESLGQQISEIINGQRKHVASGRAPPPANSVSKPVPKQPAKPTHPFFMKKPLHKTHIPPQQLPCKDAITTPAEDGSASMTERPPSRPMSKPVLSFKHAFSKVPEPMHPIWPPLGLTHVRDLSGELDSREDGNSSGTDHKKSKTPAVKINDEDGVLSSIIRSTRVVDPVLRIPSKHIISGRALQAEIAKRLTAQRGALNPSMVSSHGTFHPAVAKLYASLPTATAAFDRGEYETQAWAQKYAPTSAQQVLCATKEALMLRDWLKHLIVLSVETSNSSKDNDKAKQKETKRKRRKKSDKLEGFIVSSDDEASEMGEISGSEDELAGDVTVSSKRTVIRTGDLTFNLKSNERGRMTNAILLSGPPGCGKTASVYAVAKEMDFEVFEINAGHRRSAKDILDRIGDMTQNHLVHNAHDNGNSMGSRASTTDPEVGGLEDGKQNKLMGFFKPNSTTTTSNKPQAEAAPKGVGMKQGRNQKQSLILLEEADILFEEDKQFWSGVLSLINQSKRPIIITCNDENLVPLDDVSFHAILRYRAPSQELAVDYLLLVAANEGHILKRTAVEKLYLSTGKDLRRSLTELNYWCQMAVGSEKSGIDWIFDRWPRGRDLDSNGDKLRVLSENTYDDCMGWFSRDVLTSAGLTTETELRQEALHWWQLSLQEVDSMEDIQRQPFPETSANAPKLELLECLRFQSDYMDSRSVLDLLAATSSLDTGKDAIDTSTTPILEKQKLNYAEGYRLLHADHVPDYTTLTAEVGSTFEALLGKVFRQSGEAERKEALENKVLAAVSQPKAAQHPQQEILQALAPAMKPGCGEPPANGGPELSFEHGQRSIVEDFSPYIRAIVAFDLRLEQYRRELHCLLSGNERGTKRLRTTRASRAALEGGNKAETRKERWFSPAVNVHKVMATGKPEWQDLLVQNGYFTVPWAKEQVSREDSEPVSGSATDGSI